MSVDYTQIGKRIKELRKKNKKNQDSLAAYLDVSVGYISQLERGVTKISLDTLSRIAGYFSCDVVELLYDLGDGDEETNRLEAELRVEFSKLNLEQKKMILEIVRVVGGAS